MDETDGTEIDEITRRCFAHIGIFAWCQLDEGHDGWHRDAKDGVVTSWGRAADEVRDDVAVGA